MLVVTSSVRMVDGVHTNTLHLREDLLESGILVEQQTGLQDGLVVAAASSNNSDCGSAATENGLTSSGGQSDTGLLTIFRVTDDGGISAGRAREGSLVAGLSFDVADGCSFGDFADGEDVSNGDGGLFAAEDVLTSVGSLSGEEVLVLISVFVWIAELNLGEGSATSGIVDNALDDAPNVAVPFGVVERAVVGSSNPPRLVGLEDTLGLTLSLA